MRRLVVGLVVLVVLAGAACSDEAEPLTVRPLETLTTVTTAPAAAVDATAAAPTTTSTTIEPPPPAATPPPTTVDEWAIPPPEEIDIAYVERVLAELDRIDGEIVRDAVAQGGVDEEIEQRLATVYDEPELALTIFLTRDFVTGQPPTPGDRRTEVDRLVRSTVAGGVQCVVVDTSVDYSAVSSSGPIAQTNVALRSDDSPSNATGWRIARFGFTEAGDDECVF